MTSHEGAGKRSSLVVVGGSSPAQPAGRIPGPSSTSISFALLVTLVVLTGVFVGEWLWLGASGGQAGPQVPLVVLVVPPLVTLLATAGLTALEPEIVAARRHLEPVPENLPGAVRFRQLAADAGLSRVPRLMYNPTDAGSSARSVGRPGRYLVIVSPSILAAARRRRAVFDIIVRHELAHVLSADVARATFAVRAWHVTLVAMALPVLARPWVPDTSLLPSFLPRALVLALVVYTVRAQLLRLREHHADVAATPNPDDQRQFESALGALAPAGAAPQGRHAALAQLRRPTWLALHPSTGDRIAVVRDPQVLAQPRTATLLAAGYVAGAAHSSLHNLLYATGLNPLVVAAGSWGILLGMASLVAAAEIVRAAKAGRFSARTFAAPAAALVAGSLCGTALSVGGSGLETFVGAELLEVLVPAVVVALSILAAADVAGRVRLPGRAEWVWMLLLACGLGAVAMLWEPVGLSSAAATVDVLTVLASSPLLPGLGLVLGTAACLAMLPAHRAAALRGGVTCALLVGAATTSALLRTPQLDYEAAGALADGMFVLVMITAVAAAIVWTPRHGAAAASSASGIGAALSAATFLAILAARGVPLGWDEVGAALANWTGLAVVLAVPATGLASLASTRAKPAGVALAGMVLAAAVVLYAGIGAFLLAPGGPPVPTPVPTTPTPELADPASVAKLREAYVTGDLDVIVTQWRIAQLNTRGTEGIKDRQLYVDQGLVPLYDEALSSAAGATEWVQGTGDPLILETHSTLVEAISADRAYWLAWATRDAASTRSAADNAEAAGERFDTAHQRLLAAG